MRRSYFLRFTGGLRSCMQVLVFETPSSLIELKSAAHNFDLKIHGECTSSVIRLRETDICAAVFVCHHEVMRLSVV